MHTITITSPLPGAMSALAPGSYLADNVNAAEILARHPSLVQIQAVDNPKPIGAINIDASAGVRILVIRPGGFGDLLFLTPVFRHIKARFPSVEIHLACFAKEGSILAENTDVKTVAYPVPLALIDTYDAIVPLENTLEDEPEFHAVDRYLLEFGIDPEDVPDEHKKCLYTATPTELSGAIRTFPPRHNNFSKQAPRLAVQPVASAMCRSYSHDLLAEVCQTLHQRGWEIFFFGAEKSLAIEEQDGITNLSRYGLTIRQSAAVLTTCDVVLAPDSVLAHLAGAFDMPCVALYGPFPWKLRTAYHPKTIALSGEGACAPCFHHPRAGQHFPSDGPCAKTGRCEVLASIKPGRIAAKIEACYRAAQSLKGEPAQ